jgi:hypothetical protein
MSLPTPWVDRIFDKLTLIYGQSFLRRWADIDLNAVKSDWAHELAGFAQHPRAIAFALENLPPERPPTVLEFRAMARRAPAEDLPRLPEPKADPARVAAELAKMAPLKVDHSRIRLGRTDWAHRILARHAAGGRVTRTVLAMAEDVARRHPQ